MTAAMTMMTTTAAKNTVYLPSTSSKLDHQVATTSMPRANDVWLTDNATHNSSRSCSSSNNTATVITSDETTSPSSWAKNKQQQLYYNPGYYHNYCNEEHHYLSYPLQTTMSSSTPSSRTTNHLVHHFHACDNDEDSSSSKSATSLRRASSSTGSMAVLIPRRIRRYFRCYSCGRHLETSTPRGATCKSRFLAMCIMVYVINLLLFLGAIATYVKFSQMTSSNNGVGGGGVGINAADAMAIFATFQNSNNNRVMLAMNGKAVGVKYRDLNPDNYDVDLEQLGGPAARHRWQQPELGNDRRKFGNQRAIMERKYPVGKLPHHYNQSGYVLFGEYDYFKFSSRVVTSLIHQFPLEDRVKRMFYDETGENKLKALAPAIALSGDRILVFQRLWMAQFEKAHLKQRPTLNTAVENYVIQRQMTLDYEPIDTPSLVPIPVTTNCVTSFQYRTDGPMDARVFVINGTTYLSFHMWHIDAEFKLPRSRLFLWNENTRQMSKLKIANFTMLWTEINWVPLVVNGSLYFTYSFDPLRVIHCPNLEQHPIIWCNMVFSASESPKHAFNEWVDAFRGGGPWVHYQGPYFISFAHTHYQYVKEQITNETFVESGIYSGNLAVLKVIPATQTQSIAFRMVYISEPLLFNRKLLLSGDITRSQIINWPFAFPVGSILWNGDVVDIGVHINDSRGYVVRLNGLLALMRRVMDADKRNADANALDEHSLSAQPDIGLVHSLARETLQHLRDTTRTEMFP